MISFSLSFYSLDTLSLNHLSKSLKGCCVSHLKYHLSASPLSRVPAVMQYDFSPQKLLDTTSKSMMNNRDVANKTPLKIYEISV